MTPIVDYLIQRTDVDDPRIGLMGESLGGYFAVRAAAFEHRLAVFMALDGIWDFHAAVVVFVKKGLLPSAQMLLDRGEREKLDQELRQMIDQNTLPIMIRWVINQGLEFPNRFPYDWIQMTKPLQLEGVIDTVKCPV